MDGATNSEQDLRQALLDQEHLRLLRIGYLVTAGMKAFMSLIGLMYAFMGLSFALAVAHTPTRPGHPPPPEAARWFLTVFGVGIFGFCVALAVLDFAVARRLRLRRSRIFCMIVAGIGCISVPYGTLLGIFTFLILSRPSIMRMFNVPSSGKGGPGELGNDIRNASAPGRPAMGAMARPPAIAPSGGAPEQGDATGGIIPYKNPPALMAYYCGVFSLIPCVGLILGPIAVVLGVLGLKKRTRSPAVRGQVHAWIGIILGSLVLLAHVLFAAGLLLSNLPMHPGRVSAVQLSVEAQPPAPAQVARLSREQAIQIAWRCAADHGRSPEDYEVKSVGVKTGGGKARWSVFFNGKGEYVQHDIFFTVEIDDATGAATFRGALGSK